ncbi:MAG TPA: phosphatase PAP2 family protein [Thermoanaerobaculia bacterium]|nr:phosphatase PAP2 family protein [Thermoanaerobaculia bacterium]
MSFRDVRVEDVLAGTFLALLASVIGLASLRASFDTVEIFWWDLCFIVAPAAILAFLAAVRYGFRLRGAAGFAPVLGVLRDWFPFAFFSFTYELFRLSSWTTVLSRDRDVELLRIDRWLFGETPAVSLQQLAGPLMTDVMTGAYSLHLVLPPVLGMLLYARQKRLFREFLLAVLLSGILGQTGYLLVPAVGPKRAFPELFSRTLEGRVYEPVTSALEAVRAPRDVFPSLHVGISAIVLAFAWRRSRRLAGALAPLVLLNWVSTLYLRYHYFIDVVAGWATAWASIALAGRLLALEDRIRARWAPAAAAPPADTGGPP